MSTFIEYRAATEAVAMSDHHRRIDEARRRNILVYRNDLIERSETFVVAQATAMQRFRAVFCGLTRRPDGILPKHAPSAVLAGHGRFQPFLRKRAFMYAGWGPEWQRQCREFQPVLMHAHFALDAAFALPLCSTLQIPLVVSLHGYDITYSDRAFQATGGGRLFLRRRKQLFSQAALFLCVSQFVREKALERGYPKEKLWVHSTGIDLDAFCPGDNDEREEVVLFVGRLVEKKGCIHLIRAMQAVQQRRPLARLIVIGEGPLRSELQALAESSLPGKHRFLGAQPMHIVRAWLRRAMVFSVPSITAADGNAEGLGMAFCEAQAMGVPVVSFASGGIPEAVQDGATGYLLREGDEKSLAQKISALLENRALWSGMSLLGQERMAQRFDLRSQTEILEAKYDQVLAAAS